jgi:hypothetical protein
MEKHNGYSNWETWNVCMLISNDERLYNKAKNHGKMSKELSQCFYISNVAISLEDTNFLKKTVDWQEVADCINEL